MNFRHPELPKSPFEAAVAAKSRDEVMDLLFDRGLVNSLPKYSLEAMKDYYECVLIELWGNDGLIIGDPAMIKELIAKAIDKCIHRANDLHVSTFDGDSSRGVRAGLVRLFWKGKNSQSQIRIYKFDSGLCIYNSPIFEFDHENFADAGLTLLKAREIKRALLRVSRLMVGENPAQLVLTASISDGEIDPDLKCRLIWTPTQGAMGMFMELSSVNMLGDGSYELTTEFKNNQEAVEWLARFRTTQ